MKKKRITYKNTEKACEKRLKTGNTRKLDINYKSN